MPLFEFITDIIRFLCYLFFRFVHAKGTKNASFAK